nr:hypothetical protein [Alteromonas macleodii]
MLTYWKITFTIALVAVFTYELDKYKRKKINAPKEHSTKLGHSANLLLLAFMSFVCIGLAIEVWA